MSGAPLERVMLATAVITVSAWTPGLAVAEPATALPSNAAPVDPIQRCVDAHRVARQALQEQTLYRARPELRICAKEGCPIAIRAECGDWLNLAERQVPTVVLAATTEQGDVSLVRVLLDGEVVTNQLDGRPLEASPGPHVLTFELPDGRRQELHVVVGVGEKDRVVRAVFESPAVEPKVNAHPIAPAAVPATVTLAPNGQRTLSLVLGLVSIGSAAAATAFLVNGIERRDSASRQCQPLCSDTEVSRVRRWFILADIAGSAAVVSGGLAAYFYITSGPRASTPVAGISYRGEF